MTSPLLVLLAEAPLLALLYRSYRRGNEAAVVNTVGGIAVTGFPTAVELALGGLGAGAISFTPLLTLWIGIASVLHSLGMLGYYEEIGWWDHLTHSLSSALATALVYAVLLVGVGPASGGGTLHLAGATLAVLLALSLFWEAAELAMRYLGEWYGVDPVLIHYGRRDTALDLLFDTLGTVVVLALDLRVFVGVFEQVAATL